MRTIRRGRSSIGIRISGTSPDSGRSAKLVGDLDATVAGGGNRELLVGEHDLSVGVTAREKLVECIEVDSTKLPIKIRL